MILINSLTSVSDKYIFNNNNKRETINEYRCTNIMDIL